MDIKGFIKNFTAPPSEYRPAPLWVWNDDMTCERIEIQLRDLASHGFGGAFVHPRPGLVTEYLSEEWFALWEYALKCAKKLGIKLYIYDENSYPSGFAGGHVSSISPEALATVMRYHKVSSPEQAPGERVVVYAATQKDGKLADLKNITLQHEGDWHNYKDLYIQTLCDEIYRERGFSSNPWDRKVQFKRNVLEHRCDYNESDAFSVTYHFTCRDLPRGSQVSAVAEHPELCRLRVNGKDVPWNPGETWLDYHFGVADISQYIVSGENTVEVVVDEFNVLMEIQPIYIKGDFSVEEKNGEWVLTAHKSLSLGSWKNQGFPFYPWAVRYNYTFSLDNLPEVAELDIAEYNATAISVTVNGKNAGLIHADGKRTMDIAAYVQTGENQLSVRVCGSHKNLLGPHFPPEDDSYGGFPSMWLASPAHMPPAGDFDLLDYGLKKPPILTVNE